METFDVFRENEVNPIQIGGGIYKQKSELDGDNDTTTGTIANGYPGTKSVLSNYVPLRK